MLGLVLQADNCPTPEVISEDLKFKALLGQFSETQSKKNYMWSVSNPEERISHHCYLTSLLPQCSLTTGDWDRVAIDILFMTEHLTVSYSVMSLY